MKPTIDFRVLRDRQTGGTTRVRPGSHTTRVMIMRQPSCVLAIAMAVTKTRIRNTARPRNAALLLIHGH
jgi:hypothetical protein